MENGGGGGALRRVMFDGSKEMESPRFRAILRATSGRRKRHPPDVKSFSHELNSKGSHPLPMRKLRGLSSTEELVGAIKAKFKKLKEEVDAELGVYAGDLVGILEKTTSEHPEGRMQLEDLLVVAQKCAEMSGEDFWGQCESIVQKLDDRRQELPMGMLKQAHTRILFILTRCTRLLQFQKEGAYPGTVGEDRHVLGLHQLSDLGFYSNQGISGELGHRNPLATKEFRERLLRRRIPEDKALGHDFKTSDFESSGGSIPKISSYKKLPAPAEKSHKGGFGDAKDEHQVEIMSDSANTKNKPKPINADGLDGFVEESLKQGILGLERSDTKKMICRICDYEIPTVHAEGHFMVCTIADRCDCKGMTIDQRLERVAEVLEKILACFDTKNSDTGELCHDAATVSMSNAMVDEYDAISVSRDTILHLLPTDPADWTEGGMTPASGSITPASGTVTPPSPLLTPKRSRANVQFGKSKAFTELENYQQVESLLTISRGVEAVKNINYVSLDDLNQYMQDLSAVIETRKVDALVVETFGKRIEKLLQEKFIELCGQIEDTTTDSSWSLIDEESPMDSSVSSRASTMTGKIKDRTSIEDFEIIKPISRGAFGRVFLAKKRVTGDLFAIKVLKKADMIRKNAVESILAERNILISVRNPFVVRFYYSFTCRENLYLVMEYLNGGDLYSLLRNLGCLDEDMARMYIAELVLALEYLHSMNVIHRDLKPDNVLISRDGHIKLTDFGLSKVGLINSTDDLSGPDVSNAILEDHEPMPPEQRAQKREERRKQTAIGTPDYLAPEILLGMPHGQTADWWSVGVILFELLVGIPPFNAEHPQRIFDNIMNRDIPWPQVPAEMSFEAYDLIDKLLIENPLQRLGATGAGEVKMHPFFKDVNWEMLAMQKAMFIPAMEDEYDTSYFASRHQWGDANAQIRLASHEHEDMSETSSMSGCSSPHSCDYDEDGDEFGSMEDFGAPTLSVKYSFSNFSFKNISQLASINYDLIMKSNQAAVHSSK